MAACAFLVLLIFFASNTEAQPSLVEFEATFQRVNVFRGGLNECPETIQLTDLADVSSSLLVPISSVLFDGEVCPRDDDLNLVDNPILRTNLQFFESTNVNVTANRDRLLVFNALNSVTEFLVATDPGELDCLPNPALQDDPFFMFLISTNDTAISVLGGDISLEANRRYIVYIADDDDLNDDDSYGCVYAAPVSAIDTPVPEVSPTDPTITPTPTPTDIEPTADPNVSPGPEVPMESPTETDDDNVDDTTGTPDDVNDDAGDNADDDPICFPALGTVELENGSTKVMEELSIGDRVRVSATEFSEVFMFTHKIREAHNSFITIWTSESQRISLTPGHYLYVNRNLVPARTVAVGDYIELGSGKHVPAVRITHSKERGLYNPQTVHGDIIVNGVKASTYTTSVQQSFAHALLAPLRAAFSAFGVTTDVFDGGADCLAAMAPKGY